ncbi:MAG: D-tyrosyl-tRNA(Tyr) deacylase [bacterium]|nr:D-tyrosyl-tRNA(Tyr) deacylase [bacterium]
MRAVIQRVARASVTVDGEIVGEIDRGLLLLVGIGHNDGTGEARALADKILGLRIFPDDQARMNRSVIDIEGSVLVVSQFTLLADVRKGRRPSFIDAAKPEEADALINEFVAMISAQGVHVATGSFGAMMDVELLNAGPVTIVMDAVDGRVQ